VKTSRGNESFERTRVTPRTNERHAKPEEGGAAKSAPRWRGREPWKGETPGEHRGSRPDGDVGGSQRTPERSKTLETNDVSHRASAANVRRVKGVEETTRLLRREKL
jgi:hypothetical protein